MVTVYVKVAVAPLPSVTVTVRVVFPVGAVAGGVPLRVPLVKVSPVPAAIAVPLGARV